MLHNNKWLIVDYWAGCTAIQQAMVAVYTAQKKTNYPPANHPAVHLQKVLFPGHNHLLTAGANDN